MHYRYRLFEKDGSEAGEGHYAVLMQPGDLIFSFREPRKLRVLSLVPVESEDELNGYMGFLMVEAA
jgi:hypothetical protein